MFKFLKDKLKNAVSRFTKKVEEEVVEEPEEKPKVKVEEEPKKEKEEIKKPKEKKVEEKPKEIVEKEEEIKVKREEIKEEPEEKKEIKEKPKEEELEEKEPEKVEEPKLKKPKKEVEEKKPEVEEKKEKPEKKGFFKRIFHKKEVEPEEVKEKVEEEVKEEKVKEEIEKPEEKVEEKPEKKGFFRKIGEAVTKVSLSEQKFDEIFWELEVALLENNVALEVIEKIKEDLKEKLTKEKIPRGNINSIIISSLKNSIEELFDVEKINLIKEIKKKKPYVIIFVGVNGSGKTTNMMKFADLCLKNNLKPVIAACDTFRAAAIQQLEVHANKLNVKLIKQDYGSDAAAVAFDAIEHAKSKNYDVVLIDTAGRSHSNVNLMDELKKVIRVSDPDFIVFVGDSLTGNDAVEQAKTFNEAVGIDGIILAKTDVDDKGGAFISVSYVTGKPILYIGTGQTYTDIKEFDPNIVIKGLGLTA